jgi:hypothetical protein
MFVNVSFAHAIAITVRRCGTYKLRLQEKPDDRRSI